MSGVEGRASRATLIALAALTLATACSGPSRPCTTDEQCAPDRCDTELGACVTGAGGGTTTCDPACGALAECAGSTCENRYNAITIVSPSAAEGALPIDAVADLVLVAGRTRNDPATLAYVLKTAAGAQAATGTMALSSTPGRYTASLGVLATGSYTLEVSAENGLTASKSFVVDTTAPTLTLEVPVRTPDPSTATTSFTDPDTAYATAWRRDQVVTVTVRANEDLARATVELLGTNDAGWYSADASLLSPCDAGYCGTASLKLWEVPMEAFRATLAIRASGLDRSGNRGSIDDGGVKVTRWKWAFDATSSGALSGAAAIGSTGDVYFGTSATATTGSAFVVSPSGSLRRQFSLGGIKGTPAILAGDGGVEFGVFAVSTSGPNEAHVVAVIAEDGGTTRCTLTGKAESAVGIWTTTDGVGTHQVAVAAAGGRVVLLRPDWTTIDQCSSVSGAPAPVVGSALVTVGGKSIYSSIANPLASYSLSPLAVAGTFPDPGFAATNLVSDGLSVIASGGSAFNVGGLYAVDADGGADFHYRVPTTATSRTVISTITRGSRAPFQRDVSSAAIEVGLLDIDAGTTVVVATDAGTLPASLALGRGEYAYGVGSTGSLITWDSRTMAMRWSSPAGLTGGEAAVSLDCPRSASGAIVGELPGVLYASGSDGKLYSFIVDSRGLDTTAKWPKWQRDPRNSGNADIDLSQFACGP